MKCFFLKNYKNINKNVLFVHVTKIKLDRLKLESALVIRDLEGVALGSGFRNHGLIDFILKKGRETEKH